MTYCLNKKLFLGGDRYLGEGERLPLCSCYWVGDKRWRDLRIVNALKDYAINITHRQGFINAWPPS